MKTFVGVFVRAKKHRVAHWIHCIRRIGLKASKAFWLWWCSENAPSFGLKMSKKRKQERVQRSSRLDLRKSKGKEKQEAKGARGERSYFSMYLPLKSVHKVCNAKQGMCFHMYCKAFRLFASFDLSSSLPFFHVEGVMKSIQETNLIRVKKD